MTERLKELLEGKRISILGDSISSYEGVSNDSSVLRALARNASYYRAPFPLESTYWMRLIVKYGMRLCVNNSWSGACLTERVPGMGEDDTASFSPGVARVEQLADGQGNTPDVIVLFMGLNDLGRGVTKEEFSSGYKRVVERIKALYPDAVTFCMGMPDRVESLRERTIAYNEEIERAVGTDGHFVYVDLFHSEMSGMGYILRTRDSLHPNEGGMARIADVIENAFIAYYLK